MADNDRTARDHRLALVFGGGNALGSWQAGAYQALATAGLRPDRVVAASAGAVNAALIVGNPPDRAVERLRAFWAPASDAAGWWPNGIDGWRRSGAVAAALATGRPDMFVPRPFFGELWAWMGETGPSLFDTAPMAVTLDAAVDWDRLNDGSVRLGIAAVDLESGEDVVFDTARGRLGVNHVRASCALMPAFQPVEVEGRRYVDPGLSANLPIDAVLADPGPEPLLVIALDLLPLSSPRPRTIGEAAGRLQDLVFATQARRAIDAWQTVYDLHGRSAPAVTLVRLSYADQSREVAGKAFDFSSESAAERWTAGHAAAEEFLDRWDAGLIEVGRPGLTVYGDADEPAPATGTFRLRSAERDG